MTISADVRRQFFVSTTNDDQQQHHHHQVIRLPPAPVSAVKGPTKRQGRPWTHDEHERFLQGLEMFPTGPWTRIAQHVGTRTTRQTMTHAQKYRQRIARQERAMQRQMDRFSAADRLATSGDQIESGNYYNTPASTMQTMKMDDQHPQHHFECLLQNDADCLDVLAEIFADSDAKDMDMEPPNDDLDFDFSFVDAMVDGADTPVHRLDSDMEALLSQLDQYDLDDLSLELDQLLACNV
ncbi:hypothetical protein PINS_up011704 [Pythium insidiosum]|nr:hypothetical protein PINS_up011704 [Pythium insidiosum]